MSEKDGPHRADKLVDAYERMLKRTHDGIEKAEQETVPAFRELLHKTRDGMVELGELTREESHKVAEYVERDIKDAARYIADTGEDIKSWWRFDLDLIEQRMLDAFSRAADQTSLELHNWAEQARQASTYYSDEVAGPGTLVCASCGAELHLHKTGRIPACPKCQGTEFKRTPELEDGD